MESSIRKNFPKPPDGKTGWPWNVDIPIAPPKMPDGKSWPKISIITPSFNQGEFIEETIRSVLLQGYPNLEYIIIDGGSTDNTVEIIKKYEPWLTFWISEKDNGQSHAINKGLVKVTGEWFNWLNSDDILLPKALFKIVEITNITKNHTWLSGGTLFIDKNSDFLTSWIPWTMYPQVLILDIPILSQDSTFINTNFLKNSKVKIEDTYKNKFDTLFYSKLIKHARPVLTNALISCWRQHESQKTIDENTTSEETKLIVDYYLNDFKGLKWVLYRLLFTRFGKYMFSIYKILSLIGIYRINEWKCITWSMKNQEWSIQKFKDIIK